MSNEKILTPQKMPDFKQIKEQPQSESIKTTTTVDQLGRIVIPKAVRDISGVKERQKVFVFFHKSAFIIKPSDSGYEDYYKVERGVDSLGRVVLPIELRRMLEVKEGDTLTIYITGEVGETDFQIVAEKPAA